MSTALAAAILLILVSALPAGAWCTGFGFWRKSNNSYHDQTWPKTRAISGGITDSGNGHRRSWLLPPDRLDCHNLGREVRRR